MASLDVKVRIDRVKEALDAKGFEDLYATHYDNSPSQIIVVHDDHGRLAHGEEQALIGIIEGSDDESGLWSALEDAGMAHTAYAKRV